MENPGSKSRGFFIFTLAPQMGHPVELEVINLYFLS